MMIQIILLFSVTFLAYLIKGLTGFGNTLVMNSLLSIFKENRFITPIDLLLSIPTNTYLAWKNRRSINFKIVIPLALAVVVGNIPGILFLSIGSDHLLKVILGVVLIFLAVEMVLHKTAGETKKFHPAILGILGILSGVLMGLFGIGALLAAGINRYAKNRSQYRGNLCFIFIIDNVFRFFGYWWRGIFNGQILMDSLLVFPAAVLGMWLSMKIDVHLREDQLRHGIFILLIISGIVLILTNLHS